MTATFALKECRFFVKTKVEQTQEIRENFVRRDVVFLS